MSSPTPTPTSPRPIPTSPRPPTPPPLPPTLTLDATSYPHILDAVVANASYPSLLALRTASHSLRNRCDARLYEHILVFADGRVTSRLAPRARIPLLPPLLSEDLAALVEQRGPNLPVLPRAPVRLADTGIKVKVVDIQCPHFDWAELRDVGNWDDACPCGAPMHPPTGWDASGEVHSNNPSSSRSLSTNPTQSHRPLPRHLAPLNGLDLSSTTVRRSGPHECWVPRGANALEHLGSAYTRGGGEWYIFSPSSASRANMIRRGQREVFALAGEGVRHILEAIRHPKARQSEEQGDPWSMDSEDEEEDQEDTGLVDRCARVIADFWVTMPPDALQTWVLVDAGSWPSWSDEKHAPLSVETGLKEGVRSRLVVAGLNEEQIQAVEQRLRFVTWDEYVADIGPELARLENDDHGFIFLP